MVCSVSSSFPVSTLISIGFIFVQMSGSCGTVESPSGHLDIPLNLVPAQQPDEDAAIPNQKPSGQTELPPAVDQLGPYFVEATTSGAVRDFLAGRNLASARVMTRVADQHGDSPTGRAARLLALLSQHDAGMHNTAAPALERFARTWPLFADYAFFYSASSHHRSGQHEKALSLLDQVSPTSTLSDRVLTLSVKALRALDRASEALTLLTRAMTSEGGMSAEMWRARAAILDEAKMHAELHATLAEMATRFPRNAVGKRAAKRLGDGYIYSADQCLRRARKFFSAQDHPRALKHLKEALKGAKRGSALRCEVLGFLGRTYDKMKKRARAWQYYEQLDGCVGEPLADLTFAGGKNRFRTNQDVDALRLLQAHVEGFPERSTADDAMVMMAKVHRRQNRPDVSDALLMTQLETYPRGDHASEAAWALLWPRVQEKKWPEVVSMADRLVEIIPRETHYRAEGRTLYWRGRAHAALGIPEKAMADWRAVLKQYALSWYALLAYARMNQHDEQATKAIVEDLMGRSPERDDPLVHIPERLWADPFFRRGVELARMGLMKSARRELKQTAQPTDAEREAWRWTRAALFIRVDTPHLATRLTRRGEAWMGAEWPLENHRRIWELAHPRPFRDHVEHWGGERGIDPHWIWSIMREESGFNPGVESWANAVGLMQIILPTAKNLARGTDIAPTRANLFKPAVAIELGSKYLARLLRKHPLIPLASAGYNAGGGAVSRWRREMGQLDLDEFVERIPFRETRGYLKRVTRSYARYHWLYGDREILELPVNLSTLDQP